MARDQSRDAEKILFEPTFSMLNLLDCSIRVREDLRGRERDMRIPMKL